MLDKGETLAYEDLKITFADFDLSDFDPEAGKINFGVVFEVEHDGDRTVEVDADLQGRHGASPQITPATVPGTGGITLDDRPDRRRGRHGASCRSSTPA